jgi:hypothetical protein
MPKPLEDQSGQSLVMFAILCWLAAIGMALWAFTLNGSARIILILGDVCFVPGCVLCSLGVRKLLISRQKEADH